MATKSKNDFKPPSHSRRKLDLRLPDMETEPQEPGAPATESNLLCHEKVPGSELRRVRSRLGPPPMSDVGISKFCDRRLTRSASKRWLKVYEVCASTQEACSKVSTDNLTMKPPELPLPQTSHSTSSGVITRQRYRNLSNTGNVREQLKDINKMSQNFYKRLSFDQASNTSDYGTASEHSRKCSVTSGAMSPKSDSGDSCHCGSISGIESLGTLSSEECAVRGDSEDTAWDCERSKPSVGTWAVNCAEIDSNIVQLGDLSRGPEVTVHKEGDVCAFIPKINCSDYTGSFSVTKICDRSDDLLYRPQLCSSMRVHHVSPVVSMEPHGVQFHEAFPVMLVIPLHMEPQNDEWLSCLYSNSAVGSPPCWERLPRKDYIYKNGAVVITTSHFSLFTVVLEEPYPEVMKTIRRRTGGCLRLDEVPGVEVEFPRGCLEQDVDAYLRLLYNHEPMLDNQPTESLHGALASPVVMLGPHGHTFSTSRHPVRVKLPIPHYHEIRARFGRNLKLTVWQSCTEEGEPTHWQQLESARLQLEPPTPGINTVVISFTVHHFSFFKVVWDLVSSSLQEAKMGMSYFYPYISFSMMCQAFMEESKGDTRFGLEVICYRSDKRLPEQTNYSHRVGASLKPKLVRPGRISILLRSQMFEADVDAGEDSSMVKEEPDFRGRDFEKQYACRFRPDVNVESGTFGKVIVERISAGKNDPLFEFNLHKSGLEHEVSQPMGSERWTAFAMKELASTLQITEGNNWKRFAQHIGFTKSEIKSKFQYSPDPFLAMMNLYGTRGGTPEEFMQALYAVSRELRLNLGGMSGSQSDGGGSSGLSSTGSRGSGSRDSGSRCSKGSGRIGALWGFRPWAQVNNDSDSDSVPADAKEGAKKRSRGSSDKKEDSGGSAAKRRKFSDVSETVSSGSEGGGEDSDKEAEKSNNKHIDNRRRLNDRDMWKLSKGIARKDWRFLGRTLGIEERVLVDLEHQYQPIGFRECAYQMLLEWKGRKPRKCTFGSLYGALIRENMVEIAKHMVKILPEEEEARERDLAD